MDFTAKKEKMTVEFNALSVERQRLEGVLEQVRNRMFQLQGAFAVLEELEHEEVREKLAGATEAEAVPEPADAGLAARPEPDGAVV